MNFSAAITSNLAAWYANEDVVHGGFPADSWHFKVLEFIKLMCRTGASTIHKKRDVENNRKTIYTLSILQSNKMHLIGVWNWGIQTKFNPAP